LFEQISRSFRTGQHIDQRPATAQLLQALRHIRIVGRHALHLRLLAGRKFSIEKRAQQLIALWIDLHFCMVSKSSRR
jgi:hypothetical protein